MLQARALTLEYVNKVWQCSFTVVRPYPGMLYVFNAFIFLMMIACTFQSETLDLPLECVNNIYV